MKTAAGIGAVVVVVAVMAFTVMAYDRLVGQPLRERLDRRDAQIERWLQEVTRAPVGEARMTVNPTSQTTGTTTVLRESRTERVVQTEVRAAVPARAVEQTRAGARRRVAVDVKKEALVPAAQAHSRISLLEDPATGVFAFEENPIIEQVVTEQRVVIARPKVFAIRPYLGVGWISAGLEAGIGADLVHVGTVSLGADLRVARWAPGGAAQLGLFHAVVGGSAPLSSSVRAQIGYGFALRRDVESGPVFGLTARW